MHYVITSVLGGLLFAVVVIICADNLEEVIVIGMLCLALYWLGKLETE